MTATVNLSNVSVAFSGRTVLHEVSASFSSGEITVLVGRSGSGKTTLLRTINRLNEEFPGCRTEGQIRIDFGAGPRDVYSSRHGGFGTGDALPLTELRRKVGMLFQTPNLFPVSVYNNLAIPLKLVAKMPAKQIPERVEQGLQAVGLWRELDGRLNLPAEHLSGGQQQRLCLARLLCLEPAVLLLDEPTASLDVHAAREIEELLGTLAGRYAIIMVSHSLRQARGMADTLLVCEDGRITRRIDSRAAIAEQELADLL